MNKNTILNFLYSLILVIITAGWCRYFNHFGMESFYGYIKLPALTPPNYIFPIVWTILYVFMIISFDAVLNLGIGKQIQFASLIFVSNLFLQILWTFLFFYKAYFLAGFAVIVLLDIVTIIMIERFYSLKKYAGLLLIPYGLWLLFATYLNWEIINLNGATYPL